MPSAAGVVVIEVDPARAFGPLKNASGAEHDTPETVRAQMAALHRDWLRGAGVEVADGVAVEINPLWAMDAGELAAKLPAGTKIAGPTYFGPPAA